MAKSKSRNYRNPRRVITTNAKRHIPSRLLRNPIINIPLTVISDDRLFNPIKHIKPRLNVLGRTAAIKTKAQIYKAPFAVFQAPRNTILCVRRKIRKEVLFAIGAGGSRKPRKKPHYNLNSQFKC